MNDDQQSIATVNEGQNDLLTPTEQKVAMLWSEVLEIEPPRAEDDFIELGGDSMTLVMTEYRIMEAFSIQLRAGAMLEARTVRALARLIDAEQRKSADSPAPASAAVR
jgi:acyl carrier protein